MTPRNYRELVQLHESLSERGLRILAFPCNQFGRQEPGSRAQIRAFADGYGAQFKLFDRIKVNGPSAHPAFMWLRARLPDRLGSMVKWNFTKFLVDRDGAPVKRYGPSTPPLSILPDIERLMDQGCI